MTPEVIDIHPHIISPDTVRYPVAPLRGQQSDWSRERPQTFGMLVAEMDAAGVSKAAIVQASTYYGFDNSYVADSIASNPQRFTGVCTINRPRRNRRAGRVAAPRLLGAAHLHRRRDQGD